MWRTPSRSSASTTRRAPVRGSGAGAGGSSAAGLGATTVLISGGFRVRLGLQPGHVVAQPGADLLDRLGQVGIVHRLVIGLSGLVLADPLAGEGAALDVVEHLLHAGPGF